MMQFLSTLIDHDKSECQRRLLKRHKFQWANHERQLNGFVVADKFRNDYYVPTDARGDDTSNGDASLPVV